MDDSPLDTERTVKDAQFARGFWERVQVGAIDDCWPWTGASITHPKTGLRYGSFRKKGAHRVSWELHHGANLLDTRLCVCHTCDNPICCNPHHLWLGTNADNMADKQAKGRTVWSPIPAFAKARGEAHGSARLKAADVLAIRAAAGKTTQVALARHYGVDPGTIRYVLSGRGWKHV